LAATNVRRQKPARATHEWEEVGALSALRKRRSGRKLLALTAVAVMAIMFAGRGSAETRSVHHPFNYLSTNIPQDDCYSDWGLGCSNSGFTAWDWSEIDKNSGDWIVLGFQDSSHVFYHLPFNANSVYHVTRTGLGAPAYNRVHCGYDHHSSSYAKCTAVKFP
jgi:hypothetical protein